MCGIAGIVGVDRSIFHFESRGYWVVDGLDPGSGELVGATLTLLDCWAEGL